MWPERSLGSLWEGQVAIATLWRCTRKNWGPCRCMCIHQREEGPGTTDTRGDCGAVSLAPGLVVLQKITGLASPVPSTGPSVRRGTHSSVHRAVLRTPGFLRRRKTKARWPARRRSLPAARCHFPLAVGQRLRTGSERKSSQLQGRK